MFRPTPSDIETRNAAAAAAAEPASRASVSPWLVINRRQSSLGFTRFRDVCSVFGLVDIMLNTPSYYVDVESSLNEFIAPPRPR